LIAVDTNTLVYAHREDSAFHAAAFERLAQLAEGPQIHDARVAALCREHGVTCLF
jgi:predicted nucleic acid-binding protein